MWSKVQYCCDEKVGRLLSFRGGRFDRDQRKVRGKGWWGIGGTGRHYKVLEKFDGIEEKGVGIDEGTRQRAFR